MNLLIHRHSVCMCVCVCMCVGERKRGKKCMKKKCERSSKEEVECVREKKKICVKKSSKEERIGRETTQRN